MAAANVIEDLAVHIETQLGTADLAGAQVWLVGLPEQTDDRPLDGTGKFTISLGEYAGEGPDYHMGNSIAVRQPRVQLLVRGGDYLTTWTKAQDVWDEIALLANEAVNGAAYIGFSALNEPVLRERDEYERFVFVANFAVQY